MIRTYMYKNTIIFYLERLSRETSRLLGHRNVRKENSRREWSGHGVLSEFHSANGTKGLFPFLMLGETLLI